MNTFKFKLLAGLSLLLMVAHSGEPAHEHNKATKPICCLETAPAKPLSNVSLYQLDSSWTNDAAEPLQLKALRGRPQIVTMFFASCLYACPTLVNDLKKIEAALPENVRTNVGFVLISFDSERDTPAVLKAYRARQQMPANWTLAVGGPDDVLEIAALLGVKFKKDARGDFAHSNLITLLNAEGEVTTQLDGLNQDCKDFVGATVKSLTITERK